MTTTFTIKNPEAEATPAQINYLTSLCEKRDHAEIPHIQFAIAMKSARKGQASEWIEQLKDAPVKSPITNGVTKSLGTTAHQALVDFQVQQVGAGSFLQQSDYWMKENSNHVDSVEIHGSYGSTYIKSQDIAQAVPEFGFYQLEEDKIYCLDEYKSQYGGKKIKLMKLTKTQVYSLKEGNYVPKGKWVYAGGIYNAKKILAGVTKMTSAQAGAIGKQFSFCIKCGRYLSDPVSVANGIGPICATYATWAK